MSTSPIRELAHDELGPIAAQEVAAGTIEAEQARADQSLSAVRARLTESALQADVVERIYLGEFLPDARMANDLAIALTTGADVAFDAQSLWEHGDDSEAVKNYLSAFVVQDPSQQYPFAQLTFPATAVIMHNGREHHVERQLYFNPLTPYNFSPSFNPDISLPALVDPQLRTFAQLEELEAIDPGHARQLIEAYRMAAREQKDKNPKATFTDPLIVRMVAILPTGYDYFTDFLPKITLPQERSAQAWDPRLLVGGALNSAGDYLSNLDGFSHDKIVLNRDGKEAAFRVSRPLPGESAEQTDALVPLANHEMDRIAVILFPYQVQERVRASADYYSALGFGGEGVMRGIASKGNIGGASVSAGASGNFRAAKNNEDFLGNRFISQTGGRPVIYSIRFLTAQRDPDTIAA